MENYSIVICLIPTALMLIIAGLYFLARHFQRETESDLERLRGDWRSYDIARQQIAKSIEGYTADPEELSRQWREYKRVIGPFTMPVHHTPGNHDITEEAMLAAYRSFVGEPYYSFDARGAHFVVLDNGRFSSFETLPREQVDWLRSDLARNRDAAFTIVFFHQPWWRNRVAAGKPDPMHELFVESGVDAVFSGHYHYYFSGRYDGIMYTSVGTSGADLEPGLTGLGHHFAWVTLDGRELGKPGPSTQALTVSPVRLGAVLPWDEFTVDQDIAVAGLRAQALDVHGVSLGSALTVPQTRIALTLRNLTAFPIKGPLAWDIPEGWTVSPAEAAVDLGPRENQAFDFVVASGARVYPAPTVAIRYPFGQDKTFELRRALPVARTAHAEKASRRPKIDGELDEAIWQAPVTELFATDGSALVADPTAFYFAWDKDNLYVAARCNECRMDSLAAGCGERDCAVYAGDCVGYFLEPITADGPVYQIYFSPAGAVFDQQIEVEHGSSTTSDPGWNGTYEVATSRGSDYWLVEARIPLEQLGAKARAGDQWRVNFRRKQHRLATSADWQVPIGYDPVGYGLLELR